MSAAGFVVAMVRLALLVVPVPVAVANGRRRLTLIRGVDGALFDTVVSVGVMVVAALLLGLVGVLRLGWLTGLLWVLAGICGG